MFNQLRKKKLNNEWKNKQTNEQKTTLTFVLWKIHCNLNAAKQQTCENDKTRKERTKIKNLINYFIHL